MKYKFVVSGSADLGKCNEGGQSSAKACGICSSDIFQRTEEIGREVVRQGGILITGATTGAPYAAAKGAKEEGGVSIGISPAATYAEHVKSYRLPTENFDFIIYTGFNYSGRNLILTKAADAVIIACGGFGTLNEFTIALEDNKPIGVLEGSGGVTEEIARLLENVKDPHRHGAGKVVFSKNPKELISKLTELIKKELKEPGEVDNTGE
ncbi:MAG: LOG family protein [Candidatus Yanofskybacteria bacterium]|nr:LOG family protein [Candidatus Yanofskybacteria bacterium]